MSRSGPRQPMGRARRASAKHPSHAAIVSMAISAEEVAIRALSSLLLPQEKHFRYFAECYVSGQLVRA